jgi:hypothetical protein
LIFLSCENGHFLIRMRHIYCSRPRIHLSFPAAETSGNSAFSTRKESQQFLPRIKLVLPHGNSWFPFTGPLISHHWQHIVDKYHENILLMTVTIFPWCHCSCDSVTFLALWSSGWEEPSIYMYALVLRTRMNWLCCVSNSVLAEINMLRFVITFRNETKNWLTQTILLEDSDLLISSPNVWRWQSQSEESYCSLPLPHCVISKEEAVAELRVLRKKQPC